MKSWVKTMSEFKFACPVCTQHIRCDSSQTGSVMSCPTCFQKIVVPLPPQTADSKIIVTGQKYVEKKPDDPAATETAPHPAGTSPALLAGILVVLLVLGAGAAFWYGHNRNPAAGEAPAPTRTNTNPGTEAKKKPVLVIPPANETNWLLDLAAVNLPGTPACGRIHGLDFLAERVTLQNGVLTFRTGTHGPLETGLQINFQGATAEALAGKTINVNTDASQAATVTLRWKTDGKSQKDAYDSGYALRLEFGALANNRLPGKIYLCTPDPGKSYLMGTFNADARKPKPKPAKTN